MNLDALYLVKLIFGECFRYFDSNRVTVLLHLQLYLDANRVPVHERVNPISVVDFDMVPPVRRDGLKIDRCSSKLSDAF